MDDNYEKEKEMMKHALMMVHFSVKSTRHNKDFSKERFQ
jgi:hypothetical protein